MSNWYNSVMYYDHNLTDKLDELAEMVAERIREIESDDDWDMNTGNRYRLLCKLSDLYDDCMYTNMLDI